MSKSSRSSAKHQRPSATRSRPGIICPRCKDPADPMLRISRKGWLAWVPGAKRFECQRCGRRKTRLFGLTL